MRNGSGIQTINCNADGFQGTLNFADIEGWKLAELESRKFADTIFV